MFSFKKTSCLLAVCFSFLGGACALADPLSSFSDTFFYLNEKRWFVGHGWSNGGHQACEWHREALNVQDKVLSITLSDQKGKTRDYRCGEIHTKNRLGYGLYQARMKTAAGSGLNTAFFTYIGPPHGVPSHDEIDFEFLGKDPTTVQINYWVDGKSSLGDIIKLGFDASKEFHDYAFEWYPDKIKWFVDGRLVHEARASKTKPMPSHESFFFFSLWSGTRSMNSWLGEFTYTKPVSAFIESSSYTPLELLVCPKQESLCHVKKVAD